MNETNKTYLIPEVTVRRVGEAVELTEQKATLSNASLAYQFFNETVSKSPWFDPEKECFVVLLLNRKNRLKSWNLVTLGTATSTLAHPREVFRAAIVASACTILCMHNHPSGDPMPSSADIQLTAILREAGKTVEINLLDHVIVGKAGDDPSGRGYYSFREAGLI